MLFAKLHLKSLRHRLQGQMQICGNAFWFNAINAENWDEVRVQVISLTSC